MYYIYRFIDKKKNIIYVGKSKQELEQRFRGHTHLPDECYASVHKIEYITCSTETDMSIKEIYYINKYKNENGYFNLLDVSELPKSVEFNDKWKMYRGALPNHFSKSLNVRNNYSTEKDIRYNKDGSIDKRKPNKLAGESTYVEAFNKDEINKIIELLIDRINTAPTDTKRFVWFRNLTFFIIAINLPMKTDDLLTLKYQDVFNERNEIDTIEYKLSRFYKDEAINIPIRNICKKILCEYRVLLNYNYAYNAEDYLFKSREGTEPISSKSIWRIISESSVEVGIRKNIGTQSLRKTYGMNIYKNTRNKLKAIQFLGEVWGQQREAQLIKYLGLVKNEVDFDYFFGETFTLGEFDINKIQILNSNLFLSAKIQSRQKTEPPIKKKEIKPTTKPKQTEPSAENSTKTNVQKHNINAKNIAKKDQFEIVAKNLEQHIPIKSLSKEYGVPKEEIEQWINDYLFFGKSLFMYSKATKKYNEISKEAKKEIVIKYLSGSATQKALAQEYNVSINSISRWTSEYQKYGDKFFE